MLTFSFRDWIFEAVNIPLLRTQFKKISPHSSEEDLQNKIQLAIQADPTRNQKYVNWIFRELINNRVRLPEDANTLKDQLNLFDKSKPALKRQNKNIDIDKYTRPDLYSTLDSLGNAKSQRQEVIEAKKGAQQLYKDEEWTVIKITSKDACPYYAAGTKWCTSDPETAGQYLEDGPLYVFYNKGKVYAQLHLQSGQFMDPLDNPIETKNIPEKLKEIAQKILPSESQDDKKLLYAPFGIKEKVLTYPNGYYWGTSDFDKFMLIDPQGNDQVDIEIEKNRIHFVGIKGLNSFNKLLTKHNSIEKAVEDIRNTSKTYSKYIADFLIKQSEIKELPWWSNDYRIWQFGDLSKEDKERVFRERPNLKPEEVLRVDNNIWIKINNKLFNSLVLLNENYDPILRVEIKEDNTIYYATWKENTSVFGKEFKKEDYSKSMTDLILKLNLNHLNPASVGHYANWLFKDLNDQDQKKILQKFPHFDDSVGRKESQTKDAEEIVDHLNGLNRSLFMFKYYGDNKVILNTYDNIKLENIEKLQMPSNMPISYAEKDTLRREMVKKVHGEYEKNNHIYQISDIKNDPENMKYHDYLKSDIGHYLHSDKSHRLVAAVSNGVAKKVVPEVMKMIYNRIKKYETEKFKMRYKDNTIFFVSSLDLLKETYKKDRTFDKLNQEYNNWKSNLKVDYLEIADKVKEMKREMDHEEFHKIMDDDKYAYHKGTALGTYH